MSDERNAGFQDIPPDAVVFTSDGERIGTVREVQQGSFKLNASMQPDYWLPAMTVAFTAVDRVTLNFPLDRLGEYRSNEPLVA